MTATVDAINELRGCVRSVNRAEKFAFDLETTGLDPRNDRIRGVAVATESRQWYFQTSGSKSIPLATVRDELRPILIDRSKLCIGHNLKFDLQFCAANRIDVFCEIGDTMILAYALDENRSNTGRLRLKGKAGLIDELFDVELEEWRESALAGGLFGKPEAEYACDDVAWTMKCWNKLVKSLNRDPHLKKFYREVQMPMVRILAEMESAGMRLDVEYLKDFEKRLEKEADELEKEAIAVVGRPLNIGSSEALSRYLFSDEDGPKLAPKPWMKLGKKGLYSTDESTLTRYSSDCKLCDVVLNWRGKKKLLSTYVTPFKAQATSDAGHRIYCNLHLTGTVTGRLSSSGPNLQNIPRDKNCMRKAFVAPPGKKLIVADYGQLELRLMAHQSQDEAMLKNYRTGGDIHDITQKALGLAERTVAKNCNFGLIYGLSPQGLKDNLWAKAKIDKSIDECQQWRYGFFDTYPAIPLYHKKVEYFLREHGYVETLIKRRRRLHELCEVDFGQALRMAINFTIQGSAADLMMIAMRNIRRSMAKKCVATPVWNEVVMLVQVHDELVFEAPAELADEVRLLLKHEMENAVKLSIPLEADPKIGTNWEEAK